MHINKLQNNIQGKFLHAKLERLSQNCDFLNGGKGAIFDTAQRRTPFALPPQRWRGEQIPEQAAGPVKKLNFFNEASGSEHAKTKAKLGQSNFFPQWIKRTLPIKVMEEMNTLLKEQNIHTVCQSAHCPNIGECFKNKEATFLILGNICTRNCLFCSVKSGTPLPIDKDEPQRIAKAIKRLGLDYVVITSVTRDDIKDGGAGHFINTIKAIRFHNPGIKIEILTPDFNNNISALDKIILEKIDVFSHNIETVPRLYSKIRPRAMPSPAFGRQGRQANYNNSLNILKYIKNNSDILVKSSIILGLGEKNEEILDSITDLYNTGCDIIAIGQYLKPKKDCVEVQEFIEPDRFKYYENFAKGLGFKAVLSTPFARSSYKAGEIYASCIA